MKEITIQRIGIISGGILLISLPVGIIVANYTNLDLGILAARCCVVLAVTGGVIAGILVHKATRRKNGQ